MNAWIHMRFIQIKIIQFKHSFVHSRRQEDGTVDLHSEKQREQLLMENEENDNERSRLESNNSCSFEFKGALLTALRRKSNRPQTKPYSRRNWLSDTVYTKNQSMSKRAKSFRRRKPDEKLHTHFYLKFARHF